MENYAIRYSELTGTVYIVKLSKSGSVIDKRAITKQEEILLAKIFYTPNPPAPHDKQP